MFSIIIPTMWRKPKIISTLLETLNSSNVVKEIIIIGNDTKPSDVVLSQKVIYLPQENNIYVNPAWNLGVKNSTCDNIALINDDILIPDNLMDYLNTINLKEYGLIGASSKKSQLKIDNYGHWKEEEINLSKIGKRTYPFGIFMCFHKQHYYEIPEELKIYYGDDLLFFVNKAIYNNQNMIIDCCIKTEMSSTSGTASFKGYLSKEGKIYTAYINNNKSKFAEMIKNNQKYY